MSSGSPRHARLESTLHREVQRVLSGGLSDPRLDGVLVTVMGVSVDEPGTTAVVRVVLRPDKKVGLAALAQASPHIGRKARERMSVQRMPRLMFKLDRGAQKEGEVLEALARAREEGASGGVGGAADVGPGVANDVREIGDQHAPGRRGEENEA